MEKLIIALTATAIVLWPLASRAPKIPPAVDLRSDPDRDIDRMTSYSVLLGRAKGCGLHVDYKARQVSLWMDRVFSSKEKAVQLPIFKFGIEYHADLQKRGQSPDTCSQVRRTFNEINWSAMPPQ